MSPQLRHDRARQRRVVPILAALVFISFSAGAVYCLSNSVSVWRALDNLSARFKQAQYRGDLKTLASAVEVEVPRAYYNARGVVVLELLIHNKSDYAIMCGDIRLETESGAFYPPASPAEYRKTGTPTLWMRQVDPGRRASGSLGFKLPEDAIRDVAEAVFYVSLISAEGRVRLAKVTVPFHQVKRPDPGR